MLFSLRIALSSLSTHKLRTALAMLGIFLGALALTGVRHVSESMVKKAELETAQLGPNLMAAFSGTMKFRRNGLRVDPTHKNFKINDALALLQGVPAVVKVAPFLAYPQKIRSGNTTTSCQIIATWPDYQDVRSYRPEWGRFFTMEEEERRDMVCVLGKTIAERLFKDPAAAVGQSVFVYRARLRVLGVMQEKGRDIAGTNQDEQVFVPLSTFMRRMANKFYIHGAYMRLADGADFDATKETVSAVLRLRHGINAEAGEEDDFKVITPQDAKKLQTQALDLVQTLGIISSTLSFAVGGLGVLSIMILLVRARRMEIGIRRAVGARRRDIILQFLYESSAMATAGGAAGVAVALALLSIAYALADLPAVYDPWLITQALTGSAALGVLAGAYPAWQAAKVQVLDVLRSKE